MSVASVAEHRRLSQAVAGASDKALADILMLFDRMTDRQEADRLLDAVRPRLRRLRPPRPLSLPRLLFVPLHGAIVETRHWRREPGTLPRCALLPIAAAVRQALGDEAAAIEAPFPGRTFSELRIVDAAGRRLWQGAAELAGSLVPPPSWAATGLTPAHFDAAIALSSGVWRHAEPLWAALLASRDGPPDALVHAALTAAAAENPVVPAAILATVLLQAARPGSVAAVAAAARIGPPGSADAALDRWIDDCSPDITLVDPLGSARLAEEFAEAIDDLEASAAGRQPERRRRIAALRRDIGEACRHAYADSARRELVDALARPGPPPDDATMTAFETRARALKRLEQAGRKIGNPAAFDRDLRQVVDALASLRASPAASPVDLARLTEILAGPEEALLLLDG
jgi:hypothetical protein